MATMDVRARGRYAWTARIGWPPPRGDVDSLRVRLAAQLMSVHTPSDKRNFVVDVAKIFVNVVPPLCTYNN
jgi:hypothetical protein